MRRSTTVHIHANQINPNAQLNAVYDLQKVAAGQETDRVRKKLLNSASETEADADSYVASASPREESPGRTDPHDQQSHGGGRVHEEQAGAEEAGDSISDWA
jgi:hypothetical protein